MSPEAIVHAETDGEGQEKGKKPGEDHNPVVPGDIAHNEGAADDAGGNEDGGEHERGRGDGEDGGSTIRKASIIGRGRAGIGHVGVQRRTREGKSPSSQPAAMATVMEAQAGGRGGWEDSQRS